MSAMPAQFLSCDWGTSSFRLRLVSTSTNEIIADVAASTGVKELFQRGLDSGAARALLFAEVMTQRLHELSLRHTINGAPLIISGMASSTIGWKELPYARAPVALDAEGLRVETLAWDSPDHVGPTYLVSGVATDHDMMRGEECQAIGLLAEPSLQAFRELCVLVLPGTHSKHIMIRYGRIIDFQTYMTGELFETLSKHTILAATVDTTEPVHTNSIHFGAGVKQARDKGLAASLFRTRTRGVLEHLPPESNAKFLSGVLIGAEMEELRRYADCPVVVAAADPLLKLYSLAKPPEQRVLFINTIDRATVTAHRLILMNLTK
jgi:2-dehydro-3-deoxygalactonokinase